ncbi:MAG: IS630 family transposase [Terricaulis sp.]
MPAPYEDDLRERMVSAVRDGASVREAADMFEVAASTVVKVHRRWRDTGAVGPAPMGGDKRSHATEAHGPTIMALIEKQPDLTLSEICAALVAKGVAISRSALWRFFDRHGVSFKKTAHASEQERPDVVAARQAWRKECLNWDAARLVFIDETAISTNMARTHGRCARGERLIGPIPLGGWKTTSFIAALRQGGLAAPAAFDGAMNGETLAAYVEQILAPTLKRGDIVVWDNVPIHKNEDARRAVEARGARVLFLPPYSPDLNPIELAFSKLKALLRKAAARSARGLWRALRKAIACFTAQECKNFLAHAGFVST